MSARIERIREILDEMDEAGTAFDTGFAFADFAACEAARETSRALARELANLSADRQVFPDAETASETGKA